MNVTQRGILPPVNFPELDANLQASMLSPAGARLVAQADLGATLASSILAPSGTKLVALADLATDVRQTGSFTPGWVGFSVNPVGDLTFAIVGRIVYLFNDTGASIQGTSNTATMSITGLPVSIRPVRRRAAFTVWQDDSIQVFGWGAVLAAGTVTCFLMDTAAVPPRVTPAGVAFTAIGSKGLREDSCLIYPL